MVTQIQTLTIVIVSLTKSSREAYSRTSHANIASKYRRSQDISVFKISAGPRTLTGKTRAGPAGFRFFYRI